jgi:NAD(P)H-flavin reductase
VHVRSPESNLRVVAIEPGQFVELTLTMQAKWRYSAKEDMTDGIPMVNEGSENCNPQP